MSTIASTPPGPPRPSASAVTQTSSVKPPKERRDRGSESHGEEAPNSDRPHAEDLSDDMLLKVVRAFGGERGVIVDKKV